MAGRPKTPNAAWVARNRHARRWKDTDLAERLDVSPDTVRGWEANRPIGQLNREGLERLFGETAPERDQPGELAALITIVGELVHEIREDRARGRDAAESMLRAAEAFAQALTQPGSGASTMPGVPLGTAE